MMKEKWKLISLTTHGHAPLETVCRSKFACYLMCSFENLSARIGESPIGLQRTEVGQHHASSCNKPSESHPKWIDIEDRLQLHGNMLSMNKSALEDAVVMKSVNHYMYYNFLIGCYITVFFSCVSKELKLMNLTFRQNFDLSYTKL